MFFLFASCISCVNFNDWIALRTNAKTTRQTNCFIYFFQLINFISNLDFNFMRRSLQRIKILILVIQESKSLPNLINIKFYINFKKIINNKKFDSQQLLKLTRQKIGYLHNLLIKNIKQFQRNIFINNLSIIMNLSNNKFNSASRIKNQPGSKSPYMYNSQIQRKNQSYNSSLKEKSIQSFLHSQNQLKINSFKQSLQLLPNLQTVYFQDNSKYLGQINDDSMREGIGILETQTGQIYMGDWLNDLYHGYGIYIYEDGERYQGDLVEGMKQGQGRYFYADGRIYDGQWIADVRQGKGVERDTVKNVQYQGEWKDDYKQGFGRLIFLNNQNLPYNQPFVLLQGMWQNDKFLEGQINTQTYQGQYTSQTLAGSGVYKFHEGSVYRGQLQNNLFHGEGVFYYPNGDVYQGSFFSGLKTGYGVYKYFTGDVYEGYYNKDLKQGEGKFSFVNGNYYIGQFKRDSFNGKGKYFFNKDQWISGWWQNGQISKGDKTQDVGKMRNKTLYLNKFEQEKQIKNDRSQIRKYSPSYYSSNLQFSQNKRNVSPFKSAFQSQQKNNFIQDGGQSKIKKMNLSQSPIQNSKFMQAHTPKSQINQRDGSKISNQQNQFEYVEVYKKNQPRWVQNFQRVIPNKNIQKQLFADNFVNNKKNGRLPDEQFYRQSQNRQNQKARKSNLTNPASQFINESPSRNYNQNYRNHQQSQENRLYKQHQILSGKRQAEYMKNNQSNSRNPIPIPNSNNSQVKRSKKKIQYK